MKKVELLAPAGSYEAFLGAIHAGADAVYLGGQKFGARAYAENFTEEEVCRAVRYAHLYHRKVYLTLNTLMKDYEMAEVYDYMKPLYEAGLDGVIIQDIGLFCFLKEHFPGLELHVSTQMTITGVYGARLLKEMGAGRIVPARELSLAEMKEIKEQVDIEIEAFIHGAMCYCYSGQCLFSSMLGGRSGNRGRCAQPCRLPYRTEIDGRKADVQTEQYPLSLKDMCTIDMLPKLIEAGIDSFKIEGRMKKPEYAAGVTALYRKYIDRYYANPDAEFIIEKEDYAQLKSLYMRSGLQDGYYERHNGAEMITPHKPSYAGCDDALLARIKETYIDAKPLIAIEGTVTLKEGTPACISVRLQDMEVTVMGNAVEAAVKQPLDRAGVEKQICKTGGTSFVFSSLDIVMDSAIFMPLKALNELRREALAKLEEAVINRNAPMDERGGLQDEKLQQSAEQLSPCTDSRAADNATAIYPHDTADNNSTALLTAEVTTIAQLKAVCSSKSVQRIYAPSDLFMDSGAEDILKPYRKSEAALQTDAMQPKKEADRPSLWLVLPHILRQRSQSYLKRLLQMLPQYRIDGIMVRNLECFEWLKEIHFSKDMQTDAGVYTWNTESKRFFIKQGVRLTAPLELNAKELRRLGISDMEVIVYGRLPMMVTANCIRKTKGSCILQKHGSKAASDMLTENAGYTTMLTDRYNKQFDVLTCCSHCYNVIYNSVPLSLHQYIGDIMKQRAASLRLIFTTESAAEMNTVIAYFAGRKAGDNPPLPYTDYTTGHYKRGVE